MIYKLLDLTPHQEFTRTFLRGRSRLNVDNKMLSTPEKKNRKFIDNRHWPTIGTYYFTSFF